jgi:serine/threonine protein kinase
MPNISRITPNKTKMPKPFPILSDDNESEDRNHKIIGKGAYGCVHKPSLRCKNKTVKSYKDKISKFMQNAYAKSEMQEYKTIQSADPKHQLYLGKPVKCSPENDTENIIAINKCGFGNWQTNTHSLLVMGDGGENLSDFAIRFNKNPITPENKKKMELFWIEAQRILYGLTVFLQNDIVHHDLKGQNIVYNEEKNRINFIDFGLMTSKQKILEECKISKYDSAISHWSYPFELHLMNKHSFNRVARMNRPEKKKYIKNFVEKKIMSGNVKYFFSELFGHFSKSIQEDNINIIVNDFKDFLLDDFKDYDYVLNKCFNTIDIYGAGIGLTKVLSNTSQFIEPALANELSEFFATMITNHLPSRVEPLEAVHQYEAILEKHGLLTKYKKHFENHILQDKVETKTKLDKKIDKVKNIDLKMTPEDQANLYIPANDKICPKGKELNPLTNRCVNVCKEDEMRNEKFRCVKNKTRKNKK